MTRLVSPESVVAFLNELLELDRACISSLFSARLTCNKLLTDHECLKVREFPTGTYSVELIDVLNGLFGLDEDGWGSIAAVMGKETRLIEEFQLVVDEDKKTSSS